jgi:hypothetical protein
MVRRATDRLPERQLLITEETEAAMSLELVEQEVAGSSARLIAACDRLDGACGDAD